MDSAAVRKPFTLYVLWHRGNTEGPALARDVFRWFTAPTRALRGRGLGIPIYYRSMPTGCGGRPVALAEAECNLVVPLIDDGMVNDRHWRSDIASFFSSDECKVVPVALSESAFHLPRVNNTNCIRIVDQDSLETRSYRLRRDLTEVSARYVRSVLAGAGKDHPPDKLKVFLSHAKNDGRPITLNLKEAFQRYGQLDVFFDEVDLPTAYEFTSALDKAASSSSAGVVSVLTDSYATRPWCRRELEQARHPRRDSIWPSCWHIQPCVAVSALSRNPSSGIPELGRCSMFPWRNEPSSADIDLTVWEIMMAGYHRLVSRSLAERYPGAHRSFINWVPDPTSLLDLLAEDEEVTEIVYPGHGLPRDTRHAMERRFKRVRLQTFEELD